MGSLVSRVTDPNNGLDTAYTYPGILGSKVGLNQSFSLTNGSDQRMDGFLASFRFDTPKLKDIGTLT